jgi:sugar fermentation stimulation protein A
MQLPPIRQPGTLIRRYKRFLADIELEDGTTLTVHCPNSGSMRGCSDPGSPVIISRSDNKKRKYAWTLEMVRVGKTWVGVNTAMTNRIVREGLENGIIDDFGTITGIRPEVRVSDRSRLDFQVETNEGLVYIEVKNCSLVEDNQAIFPDAVTVRGTRHLLELEHLLDSGVRAAVLFCVQRADGICFRPASEIDPTYSETLYRVQDSGVLILAYRAAVQPEQVTLTGKLPLCEKQPWQKNEKKR